MLYVVPENVSVEIVVTSLIGFEDGWCNSLEHFHCNSIVYNINFTTIFHGRTLLQRLYLRKRSRHRCLSTGEDVKLFLQPAGLSIARPRAAFAIPIKCAGALLLVFHYRLF